MKKFFLMMMLAVLVCVPLRMRAQSNCDISLPYTTGFETDVSNLAPTCWTTLSGEAYAFNFIYYAHTGSQILALNSASGEAKIATPRIPAPLNEVAVSLWYVDLAWSASGVMRVGFATSPTGTVQWLDTIAPSDDYVFVELDFTDLSITDTGYLVFSYNNTSGSGSGLVDDMTIYRNSSCDPVTNLHVGAVSNSEATIVWNENGTGANGFVCYIADTNDRQSAFDSVFVPAGTGSYTFSSLAGNSQYYVWVKSYCGGEYSLAVGIGLRTNPDCGGVRDVVANTDYRLIALSWNPPAAGEEATEYIVDYRLAGDTHWVSATTTELCFFLTGLQPDSRYEYRIVTLCSGDTGDVVTGRAYTAGCEAMVMDSARTHGSLPLAYSSGNSYTQQLYLAGDLTGIDTITGLTFFLSNDYVMDVTPVVVYLGNTSKTQFNSGSDYVPAAQLSPVYEGEVTNVGREVTVRFDTPFVRVADSSLVVAVDNNYNDFASSFPQFVVGNGNNRSIYRSSLGDINPASPGLGSRANYVNRVRFVTRGCAMPQCDRPLVCVEEVGDDYVDVAWNRDTGVTYRCEIRGDGEGIWTVVDSAVAGDAFHFGDLEVGHSYEIRVSRLCGSDTLEGRVVAMLPCLPVGVPFSEDFDLRPLSARFDRPCWNTGTLSTTYFRLYPTVVSLPGSINKVCQLSEGYVVLPQFNRPLNELQVRFDLYQSSDNDVLVLGVIDNLYDTITTVVIIDSFSIHNVGVTLSDSSFLYNLSHLSLTNGHLVFMSPLGNSNLFIDNIRVEAIPDCPPVEQCSVAAVTNTSATLVWAGPEGVLLPTGYLVEYGPRFFEQGTGTTVVANGYPFLLTGLDHSSDYDVYIHTVCMGDTTPGFGPVRFSTQCAPVSQMPYVMDFESVQNEEYTLQTLPTCWFGEAMGNGSSPEVVYSEDTAISTSGHYSLKFTGTGIVALPLFIENLNGLAIQFHLYRSHPGTSTIIVGVVDSADAGFSASFTPIDTVAYMDNGNECDVTVYLSDYAGTGGQLALRSVGASFINQYVDDLVVDHAPECIPPQHVSLAYRSATTVTLAWRVSQAARYSVEYGLAGFAPGTGMRDTALATGITLAALQPGMDYDVRISSLCAESESTPTLFSFTTLRGMPVTTYPYVCTFGDSTSSDAWQLDNGSQTNRWCVGTAVHADGSDSAALYISDAHGQSHTYNRSQVTHAYAYRAFEMTHTSYRIHYDWMARGESGYDFLRVFLVPGRFNFVSGRNPAGTTTTGVYNNTTPQGWIALDGNTGLSNQTEWQHVEMDFEIPAPGDYYLLFYWLNDGSGGTQPPAAVDNIGIELRGCPTAANLASTGATSSSVAIAWTGNPRAQQYEVEYGPAGYEPGTGITIATSGNAAVISGLEADSAYDFYVTTICGDGWFADSVASLLNVRTLPVPIYSVTLLANNDAWGSVDGGGTYEEGAVATLSATPAEGYYFASWDDGLTDNPRSLTVTSDTTLTALFAERTGIADEPQSTTQMRLYPNPASGVVSVSGVDGKTVVVVDITGREMLRQVATSGTTRLDVSRLAKGTYFVWIEENPGNLPLKLIVK